MTNTTTSPATDTPWFAEPSEDGFYRVVKSMGIVLAQKCVKEEAQLFSASARLLTAAHLSFRAIDQLEWDYETVQHHAWLTLGEVIQEAEGR